ncbi:MAG: hypothetical protein K2W94_00965 [Alphaproteobacteria bacterium]|nr:hypothetical protein [Alphaproteobacteria bacterium]
MDFLISTQWVQTKIESKISIIAPHTSDVRIDITDRKLAGSNPTGMVNRNSLISRQRSGLTGGILSGFGEGFIRNGVDSLLSKCSSASLSQVT